MQKELLFFGFKTQFMNYIIQDGTDQESRYVNVQLSISCKTFKEYVICIWEYGEHTDLFGL